MKSVVTVLFALLCSPLSFAEATEKEEKAEKEMVELVVTAEKISESTTKPQVEDEEVQGFILADLSDRLSESVKPI